MTIRLARALTVRVYNCRFRRAILDYDSGDNSAGEVAEWFKATVLKTVVGLYPTVGSNPTLSAIIKNPSWRGS